MSLSCKFKINLSIWIAKSCNFSHHNPLFRIILASSSNNNYLSHAPNDRVVTLSPTESIAMRNHMRIRTWQLSRSRRRGRRSLQPILSRRVWRTGIWTRCELTGRGGRRRGKSFCRKRRLPRGCRRPRRGHRSLLLLLLQLLLRYDLLLRPHLVHRVE